MAKRIVLGVILMVSLFLLCTSGSETNQTNTFTSNENAVFIEKRRHISKKKYAKIVSDTQLDKRALASLYALYKMPVKGLCVYSVAGCISYKDPEKNIYMEATGRAPQLYGIEATYALDEYWGLFTHDIVPSGPGINERYKKFLVQSVKDAYDKYGSIPVIVYHMANPYSPLPPKRYGAYQEYKDSEHKNVVSEMRLGKGTVCGFRGRNTNPKEYLDEKLDSLASLIKILTDKQGNPIPCIIRPFHEMDMNSFWWGVDYCTPEDYIWLYHYTRDKISKQVGTHNLIWGYSLGCKFATLETMMERYPGNDYVDIIGGEEYNMGYNERWTNDTYNRCMLITQEAFKRNKVCGLFECGVSQIEEKEDLLNGSFYTTELPNLIKHEGIDLSFILGFNGTYMPTTDEGRRLYRAFVRSRNMYKRKLK